MPQLGPAIPLLLQGAGILTAIEAAGLGLVLSFAAGSVQQQKARRKARDAFNASLQDRYVMTSLADAARSRIYGRARNVDGILYKAAHGADNRYYSLIVALCDAPTAIEAVDAVYFNDVPVTLDGSGYVQTAPWAQTVRASASDDITTITAGAGSVTLSHTPVTGTVSGTYDIEDTSGVNAVTVTVPVAVSLVGLVASVSGVPAGAFHVQVQYQWDTTTPYARVRSYLGGSAQDLHTDFADLPGIVSTDKFAGIALLRVDLEYSQDAFPTGLPNISAIVRGCKVLDPRSSTTAYTQNPALIVRDWSLYAYGGGLTSAQYNDTFGNAAANACDVDATFTTGATPVTMDTFQCGIVCKLDASPQDWLGEMVESMAGRWGWAGGKLCIRAGAYTSPVATITEGWVTDRDAIDITKDIPLADMANAYRSSIANRDNHYIVEPMPELAPSAYSTADGGKFAAEVAFGGVTKREHALHVAGVLLRDARQSLRVQLPCNYNAFALELFDVVAVTLPFFGWSAKTFEVLGWSHSLTGGVTLQLKETAASIYTVDASFTGLENDDNTDLPDPTVVPEITGFAATSNAAAQADGQIVTKTLIYWDAVTDINVLQSGWVEIQYLLLGVADEAFTWQNNSAATFTWANNSGATFGWTGQASVNPGTTSWDVWQVRGDQTSTTIPALRAGGVYLMRARAINTMGVRGKWCAQILIEIDDVADLLPTTSVVDIPTQAQAASASAAGPVTVTVRQRVPDGFAGNQLIASVPFSAELTGQAAVTVTAQVSVTTVSGADQFTCSLQQVGGSYSGFSVKSLPLVAAASTATQPVTLSAPFAVVAGQSYEFGFYGNRILSDTTITVTNVQLIVQATAELTA